MPFTLRRITLRRITPRQTTPSRTSAPPARRKLITAFAAAGMALGAATLPGPAHAATAARYRLVVNPLVNSFYSEINLNGDIIGGAPAPQGGAPEAALFRAGSSAPLFLNAPSNQTPDNPLVTAEFLNNAVQVVGESDTGINTALLWPGTSTPTDLSQLPALATTMFNTNATGINNHGLIVGWGQRTNDAHTPFTIQNNAVKTLPALPNGGFDAEAVSVSDTGIVVGDADTTTQDPLAVEWVGGKIKQLPSLAGTFTSKALAVDNSGAVVGAAVLNSDLNAHAVLWANGKATDLGFGTVGDAEANGINSAGVIVGDGNAGDGGGGHAFIWQNGTTTDLNTLIPAGSGVTLATASGINDHGDIVGVAVAATGGQFGYELIPTS